MKRTILFTAGILILLVAYGAWPLMGLKKIAEAVQTRDVVSLSERIDAAALKRSLVDQLGRTYLRVSGKDKGLSPLEIRIALQLASTLVGPRVDDMLKPEGLMDILAQGGAQSYGDIGQVGLPRLEGPNLSNFFQIMRNTEYSGTRFSIILPLASDEHTGYRVQLTLDNWTWKLTGIGLPENTQIQIASEILRSAG